MLTSTLLPNMVTLQTMRSDGGGGAILPCRVQYYPTPQQTREGNQFGEGGNGQGSAPKCASGAIPQRIVKSGSFWTGIDIYSRLESGAEQDLLSDNETPP